MKEGPLLMVGVVKEPWANDSLDNQVPQDFMDSIPVAVSQIKAPPIAAAFHRIWD